MALSSEGSRFSGFWEFNVVKVLRLQPLGCQGASKGRIVNGSVGVKWQGGAVTTTVKVTNLFNQTVQQHIFGDLLRRTVVGEVKFTL